ncbi:MAG TPA: hypothetical protein VHZ51_19365 [Ktedonobacteraceae bacterium]|nr:hypothetical protein [Ktedonobacteraceae bacterium]
MKHLDRRTERPTSLLTVAVGRSLDLATRRHTQETSTMSSANQNTGCSHSAHSLRNQTSRIL